MKKIFLVLFGFFSLVSLYSEGIKVDSSSIGKSLKLNGLVGSITEIEDNNTSITSERVSKLLESYENGSSEEKTICEQIAFFSSINFGYNPVFADHVFDNKLHVFSMDRKTASYGNIHLHYIKQGRELVSDVFNSYKVKDCKKGEKGIIKVGKQEKLPSDFSGEVYFVVPDFIKSEYEVSVFLGNKEQICLQIVDDSSYSMFAVDKKLKDLTGVIKLVFENKKDANDKVELTYMVTPIDNDIFEKAITAIDRMDKRIGEEEAWLSYNFGKYLQDENYKYSVTNLNEETLLIKNRLDNEYKRKGVVVSENEMESRVLKELNKGIKSDVDKLQTTFEKVTKDFYNSDYNLFNSKYSLYKNGSFIVGLKSIYLSNIDKEATFTSMGDIMIEDK